MNILTLSRCHVLKLSWSHAPAAFLPMILLGLAGLPSRAADSITATGWLQAVPVPGITCTNSSGVYLKGNVHLVRILSDDERARGRLQAWMDLAYQPDGSAIFSGPAYSEVGVWDSAGTNFTPSGGVWALNYTGAVRLDGSSQYNMAGYGIGGNIEGLRLSARMTRSNQEPTTPYLGSGTITPAPVATRVVVDDFSDGRPWTSGGAGAGTLTTIETSGQFTLVGDWRGIPTWNLYDTTAWCGMLTNWSVPDGQTLEARVDLVNMNDVATGVSLNLYSATGAYGFSKGGGSIGLWKHVSLSPFNWGLVFFCGERVITSNSNVVLSLSITPAGGNVVLVGKVLDKQTGAVLHQITCMDTPAVDPSLSQAEIAALTGCGVWHDWGADPAGPPLKSGNSADLFVFQDTDGTKPPATATFDNLELFRYEIPRIGIERALRLSWPSTGMPFAVEAAPTVQGPWLPVADTVLPGMQYFTVPANDQMGFFRLQQAP